jgi:hypothetical protein
MGLVVAYIMANGQNPPYEWYESLDSDSLTPMPQNSLMWVICAPIDIRVLDFTSYSNNVRARNMNSIVFSPWSTLSLPFVKGDILISGLDKIMNLLNCSFHAEPFIGFEDNFADLMEYGSEPWVYHFRQLLAEAQTPLIGLGLRLNAERNPLAHNLPFDGFCVEKIVGFA